MDEVYDKVLYDGIQHTAMGSLSTDVLTLTFNSLSKAYRSWATGGWMVVSGDKARQGLHRRPEHAGQHAPVLQHSGPVGHPDRAGRLPEHRRPDQEGGRLRRQRDLAYELITAIPA